MPWFTGLRPTEIGSITWNKPGAKNGGQSSAEGAKDASEGQSPGTVKRWFSSPEGATQSARVLVATGTGPRPAGEGWERADSCKFPSRIGIVRRHETIETALRHASSLRPLRLCVPTTRRFHSLRDLVPGPITLRDSNETHDRKILTAVNVPRRLQGFLFDHLPRSLRIAPLLSLLLCGCGSDRPVDPLGRHTVVWLYPTDVNRPMIEGLVRQFEKENPDIHIDIRAVPGAQYQTKLKTLVAAGSPPDVFVCGDVFFAYLKPFLSDLTDLTQRDAKEIDLDDYYPAVRKAMTPGGRIYFLPQWFNVSLLYYNRTLFRAANEPFPNQYWTWTDYAGAAKRLTRNGTWGSSITTGWWGEWLSLVHGAGGDLFDPRITHCTLDTPQAIEGLTFYRDTITPGKFAPPPGEAPSTGFASGKLAMDYGGHVGLWATYRKIPSLDWDIEVLPKGPSGRRGGEISLTALAISKASPERECAWRFIKFMSSKESIRDHVAHGYLAIRRSVAKESQRHDRNYPAIERALATAEPIPSSPDFVEIALDLVQPEIDRMLTDNVSPADAAKSATRAANAFLVATKGGSH